MLSHSVGLEGRRLDLPVGVWGCRLDLQVTRESQLDGVCHQGTVSAADKGMAACGAVGPDSLS